MELRDKILDVIGGPNISAFATVQSDSHPVATHKSSIKMSHIKNNPKGCITIWNGKDFEDINKPYVVIDANIEIIDDEKTKNEFWNPMLGNFFSGPDDPEYVIMDLKPYSIEYYSEGKMEKLTSI